MLLQKDVIDKSVFDDGLYGLELLFNKKVAPSLFSVTVNLGHSSFEDRYDLHLLHGLGYVLHNSQSDGFLGVVELIVGRHYNEDGVRAKDLHLLDSFDAVNARHMNIYHCDVRAKALSKLYDAPSALCAGNLTGSAKLFFYNEFHGIDDDTFVITNHHSIHSSPPMGSMITTSQPLFSP